MQSGSDFRTSTKAALDPGPQEFFDLGPEFKLTAGYTLEQSKIAYKTHGTLSSAKDNAVLFPHHYSGTSASMKLIHKPPMNSGSE
jgi:homoserine acetyltransferase